MLHAVRITFICFSEGEISMSRHAKIKFAALLTAVVTTMGTAGVTAAIADDGSRPDSVKTGGGWCC